MAIGDVNSDARGSGARFNDGKVPLEYIPVSAFRQSLSHIDGQIMRSLDALACFQAGDDEVISVALRYASSYVGEAALVLAYGAQKYAPWNWAKGMPWSVCFGSAMRHVYAVERGESIDAESGLHHYGHYTCNLLFLAHYAEYYPEGDDRPPRSIFQCTEDHP